METSNSGKVSTFQTFGATQNIILPLTITAASIVDPVVRSIFHQFSKASNSSRFAAFDEISKKIPSCSNGNDFNYVILSCFSVFESSFFDENTEIRFKAISMIESLLPYLKKTITQHIPRFIPILLLYCYDVSKNVTTVSKNIFEKICNTPEKKKTLFIKLRPDITKVLRKSFEHLLKDLKQLSSIEAQESWGRIAGSCLNLSSNLISICKTDQSSIFNEIGNPPVFQWISVDHDLFLTQSSPSLRSAAYNYITLGFSISIFDKKNSENLLDCFRIESNVHSQAKLLKCLLVLIEISFIQKEQVRPILENSIHLYFSLETKIVEFVKVVCDLESYMKVVEKVVWLKDRATSQLLYPKLMELSLTENPIFSPPKYFFLNHFKLSITSSLSFLSKFDLTFFNFLKDSKDIEVFFDEAIENRFVQFLILCSPCTLR